MRAVVLDADGLPELADLPEPTAPGLLVRVRACGLCGSDVEKLGRAAAGTVLGHEVAGELESGDARHRDASRSVRSVRALPRGARVDLRRSSASCGSRPAASPSACARRTASRCPTRSRSIGGVWVEPLACVLRAAESCRAAACSSPVAARSASCGCRCCACGATRSSRPILARSASQRRALLGAEAGDGPVDGAVVTAAAGINDALRRLEPGGTLLVFSAPEEDVPTSLDAVYRKELRVVGSRSATPEWFHAAVELLPALVLPEVTILPLERFREGVDLYRRGAALKVVFTP